MTVVSDLLALLCVNILRIIESVLVPDLAARLPCAQRCRPNDSRAQMPKRLQQHTQTLLGESQLCYRHVACTTPQAQTKCFRLDNFPHETVTASCWSMMRMRQCHTADEAL